MEALRSGLRDLRHVEGKDIIIDLRWAERIDQLPELAAELVHMDVDIIIAPASTEVEPVSYGADFNYMYRHAALYVDKILNGEKPADLPVEQASRYELAIKS